MFLGPRGRLLTSLGWLIVASILGIGVAAAQLGPVARRALPALSSPAPTLPPLPYNPNPLATPAPDASSGRGTSAAGRHTAPATRSTAFRYLIPPPLPVRVPTYAEAMRHLSNNGRRHTRSASGSTIILNGSQTVPVLNEVYTYGWDGTIPYGSTQQLQCLNAQANTSYQYVVFAPKRAAGLATGAAVTSNAAGACTGVGMSTSFAANNAQSATFQTPFAVPPLGTGLDAAYPAVWPIGLLNTATGKYEAITFVVVASGQTITTYPSGGTVANATNDFAAGTTINMTSSNLNTTDKYAYGINYTADSRQETCVTLLPAGTAPANGPCFNNGGTINTISQPTGTFTAGWNTTIGNSGMKAGTYTIELYDATLNAVVGSTQISIQTGGNVWTLSPFNGATAGSVNGLSNDYTFAFDGAIDQSTTGIDFKVTGLNTDPLTLTISDPAGVVNTAPVLKAGTATTDFGVVTFPLKVGANDGFGFGPFSPFVDVFGPTALIKSNNVYTAQVYDRTTNTALASKSFVLLGYFANFAWTTPNTSSLQPAAGTTVTGTFTISNTGYAQLGDNNADALTGFVITGGATQSVALVGGVASTTATDTNGNVWNVVKTAPNGGTITITPVLATTVLNKNVTLSVPVVVTIPAGNCAGSATQCFLSTSIMPLHGIKYSAVNTASSKLYVQAAGASAVAGNFQVNVTGYPAPIAAQRFGQLMYVQGTAGATGSYNLNLTVSNPAAGVAVHSGVFTLPPGVNASSVSLVGTPSICAYSKTVMCQTSNQTGSDNQWIIAAASSAGVPGAQANDLYFWDGTGCNTPTSNCGIQPNTNEGFVIAIPMYATGAAYQGTQYTGNPDGGCPVAAGTFCSGGSLQTLHFAPDGVLTNSPVHASGTNLDSSELGIFSLNPAGMNAPFSPATIGAGVTVSTTFNFQNAQSNSNPNPDYIDKIFLSFPAGAAPASVTVADPNWTVTRTAVGPPETFTIALTCIVNATCLGNVTNAIAPGATFPVTVNYTGAQTTGNYNVTWSVEGANGGVTSSTTTSPLAINSTSATAEFYAAGGSPNPTVWNNGLEPLIGSDSVSTVGNAFVYRLQNNGSTAITQATITIPNANRALTVPSATTWPNGTNPWLVTSAVTYAATSTVSGCSAVTVVQPTAGAAGSLSFTCPAGVFVGGKIADLAFTMQAPYDVGSDYQFDATLNGGAVTATPAYTASNWLQVVVDARLTMFIPNAALQISRPGNAGGAATATCPATCVFTPAAGVTPAQIDLGSFSGTFLGNNLMNASVISDAPPTGWSLFVSVDNNPNNISTSTPLLSTRVNTANSSAAAGYSIVAPAAFTAIPVIASPSVANPGLAISKYTGAVRRGPNEAVDTLMDFQITGTGDLNTQRTVLTTYTLFPN